jgi:hypothetical protein
MRAFWKPELRHELRLRCDEEYVEAFTERSTESSRITCGA